MITLPTFGTKQGLIDAVNRGREVMIVNHCGGHVMNGMITIMGDYWYATVTVKDGKAVKVT